MNSKDSRGERVFGLETEEILKLTTEDRVKISSDDFGDADVGQYYVLHRGAGANQNQLLFELSDEEDAKKSNAGEIGVQVSEVEGQAVTLEVISPLEQGSGDG